MSSANAASHRIITLESSDSKTFLVKEAVAIKFEVINDWILDSDSDDSSFPLPNVSSEVLEKVLLYCERHVEAAAGEDLTSFDDDFVNVELAVLYRLMKAAMYLKFQSLIDLIAQTLATKTDTMNTKKFRSTFNIKNSYSINQEDRFFENHRWALEKK